MHNPTVHYDFVSRNKCCEDISRYTVDKIRENGYDVDSTEVCTEDGYYLTLFRIRKKLNSHGKYRGKPILLVHGLTQSSAEFLMEKQQLAYVLAEEGYDVWIGNCRGTTFSRKHRFLDDTSEEYWNYSFHEIGLFDISKFIDHILEKTRRSKVYYVGVSQGCSVLSVLLSLRHEYNRKIEVACLLCPGLKFTNTRMSLIKFFFMYITPLLQLIDYIFRGILKGDMVSYLIRVSAFETSKFKLGRFWNQLLWGFFGGYTAQTSSKWIDFQSIFRTSPNTVSLKQVVHYSQIMRSGRFSMYDYDTRNEEIYKKKKPPLYDFTKISAPVALFYSKNDSCYAVKDMEHVSNELGNCVHRYVVEDEDFNHFDFVYHKNAYELVYKHILDFLGKFSEIHH